MAPESIILACNALAPAVPFPGGLEGLPTFEEIPTDEVEGNDANGKPIFKKKVLPVEYVVKELARVGDWCHRGHVAADGEPMRFTLNRNDLDGTVENFNDRKEAGILPWVPDYHEESFDASRNNGQVIELKRDGDSLVAKMKIVGSSAIEKTRKNDVSVWLDNADQKPILNAYGKRYKGWVLQHVSMTPNPAIPHLKPFTRIAASADQPARDVPVYVFDLSADDSGGHWVTIEGAHVFIGKGGTIEKGPSHLVGKKPSEVGGAKKDTGVKGTDGWKLHLATDHPDEVSAKLKENGITHKVGRSGGQEGKDVTVYAGSRDEANRVAGEIDQKAGHLLKPAHGEVLKDDQAFTAKIYGRFDIGKSDSDFHQYGASGVPFHKEDMDPFNPVPKAKALARAHATLTKRYGTFYGGSVSRPLWMSADPFSPNEAPSLRSYRMKPELAQQVRAKLGFGADVPDDQLDDKAAEKALALSADVQTLTTERDTLKGERDAKAQEVLSLSADAPRKPDDITLAMYADNVSAKREAAIKSGALTPAQAKLFDAIVHDAGGNLAPLALSACGTDRKPLAFKLWDAIGQLGSDAVRTGNAIPRGATPAEPALSLSGDDQPEKADPNDVAEMRRRAGLPPK